jgi:hypothetical protein
LLSEREEFLGKDARPTFFFVLLEQSFVSLGRGYFIGGCGLSGQEDSQNSQLKNYESHTEFLRTVRAARVNRMILLAE